MMVGAACYRRLEMGVADNVPEGQKISVAQWALLMMHRAAKYCCYKVGSDDDVGSGQILPLQNGHCR